MRNHKEKYYRHLQIRSLYQIKRLKWAKGTLRRKRTKQQARTRKPDFVDLVVPNIFNLQYDNVTEVLEYIAKVKEIGKSKRDVNFILDKVEEIGVGAISMLISVMQELEERHVFFKGNKPDSEDALNALEKSGFMKYVKGTIKAENVQTRNAIFTTGKAATHQNSIVDAIHSANKTVWGEPGRSPLLYGTLVEMIKNSCKHAFKSKDKVRWHIGVSHDEENKKVKFSFVDNGIGIIKSFEMDDIARQAYGMIRNNAKMIELAYKDGIESKTGLSWRGTGLPTIYEAFGDDRIIRRLVVITNDVYCDFEKEIYKVLNKSFSGTYYYWEMDQECVKHCFLGDD